MTFYQKIDAACGAVAEALLATQRRTGGWILDRHVRAIEERRSRLLHLAEQGERDEDELMMAAVRMASAGLDAIHDLLAEHKTRKINDE